MSLSSTPTLGKLFFCYDYELMQMEFLGLSAFVFPQAT